MAYKIQKHRGNTRSRPKISVVIPAFNEEDRLGQTLSETTLFFTTKPYDTEIIVVDDGSIDKTTRLVMSHFNDREVKKLKNIKVHLKRHLKNKGKGRAVATGIAAASGSHILIIDADGSIPITEFDKLYRETGLFPFVIGSRDIGQEERVLQGAVRRFIGKSAKLITKTLFNLPIKDTQCGFKLIEARLAKDLISTQFTDRWGFDVEYLVKAHGRQVSIKEIGVRWYDKAGGKVAPLRDSIGTLIELLKIRGRL